MTTIVLQSGMKWGTTRTYSRTAVAGLLPLRHLGSTRHTLRHAARSAMGLDHLSRNVRAHPGREEPAYGAVEVPFHARGTCLPREGSGTLPEPVSRRDVRRDGAGGAGADEPALDAEARVLAAVLRERDEHGARRSGSDHAAAALHGARRDQVARGDRGRRGRLPRAVGSRHLGELRIRAGAARA